MKRTPKTQAVARFSATVEPEVLEAAQQVAKLSGFRFSFSAYVNDLMKRDVAQRQSQLACVWPANA